MSDLPIKATLKAGAGYEAPWLTVDADNPDELVARLDRLAEVGALGKVAEVAELFRAGHAVAAGLPPAAQGATVTHINGGAAEPAPAGQVKTCAHGVRKRVEGTNNRGKWVGWFCPLEKGNPNQCAPEWD